MVAALAGSLVLGACGSNLPETHSGTKVQTSYLSLDQRPALGGTAKLLPAPASSQTLIGSKTTADVVIEGVPGEEHHDDPSGRIVAGGVATSAAGYAIGTAGAISLGTAMVLTGPLMLPWALEEADIAADRRTITKSVVEFGFAEKLKSALIRALDRTRSKNPDTTANPFHIELGIIRYGLAQEGATAVSCFSFEGRLQVRDKSQTHYQEPILWSSARRNEDLPPVRCADLDEMARSDGALAKEILDEATIILAAAAIRRLTGGSP